MHVSSCDRNLVEWGIRERALSQIFSELWIQDPYCSFSPFPKHAQLRLHLDSVLGWKVETTFGFTTKH